MCIRILFLGACCLGNASRWQLLISGKDSWWTLKVLGGMEEDNMLDLLDSGFRNDTETFTVRLPSLPMAKGWSVTPPRSSWPPSWRWRLWHPHPFDPTFWPAHAPKDLQVNYQILMRRKYLRCVSHYTKCNTIFHVSLKVWDPPKHSAQAAQAPSAAHQVHLFSQEVITCDQ